MGARQLAPRLLEIRDKEVVLRLGLMHGWMEEDDCRRRLVDMFLHPDIRQEVARSREAELIQRLQQMDVIRQAKGGDAPPQLNQTRTQRQRRRWAELFRRPIAT